MLPAFRSKRLRLLLASLALAVTAGAVVVAPRPAGADDFMASLPGPPKGEASGRTAVTIWLPSSRAGKKEKAAETMTAVHDAMASRGWGIQDIEPYVENGDLVGFWLTYTDARR